jgi:CheY-like chemotaxis protein
VALQGNLEDLPLLDIIQIVSFSKKTGYLSIEMEGGEGAIVFCEGLVVSAFTATSPPADPRLGSLAKEAREQAVRRRLGFALERLARLREGSFSFELADDVPAVVGHRDIRLETLLRGINPQELLLDLAQGLDEDRAQSAAAVEASFAAPDEGSFASPEPPLPGPPALRTKRVQRPPADGPPAPRAEPLPPAPAGEPTSVRLILLVDDEADVRQILGLHFAAAGYRVAEAGDPEEAAKVGRKLAAEGPFVLVTDLGMPASGGASFHGGFEVVKRLWRMNLRPPVLMMTESLNQSLRLRARQMGVQSFVFKPTLSKLSPRQFEADLSAFAEKLVSDVLPRLAESAALRPATRPARPTKKASAEDASDVGPPADSAVRPFHFLKRRLLELREGGDANQIAVLVMKAAREFFERAILFVVKNEEARGLGGFGIAPRDEALNLLARQVLIPLGEPSAFHDVAHGRRALQGAPAADRWVGHLMGRIGRFQSRGFALLPLVAHRETIAILFGDNPETGREPAGLEALEVFIQQAGIALENVFLQRKLQTTGEKDRVPLR